MSDKYKIKDTKGNVTGTIEKGHDYSYSGPEDRGEGFWLLMIGNPMFAAIGGVILGIIGEIVTIPGRTIVAAIHKAFGGSLEARATILAADPMSIGLTFGKISFGVLIVGLTLKWFTKRKNLEDFAYLIGAILLIAALIFGWHMISGYANS